MLSKIRLASPKDIDELICLENSCFKSDKISNRQWRYLLNKAKAKIIVVEVATKIVGAGLLFTPKKPKPARLYSLAVDANYRSQGLASQMMDYLLNLAKKLGYRQVRLEVRQKDLAVVLFYESRGFAKLNSLPEYYEDGADGWRMIKYFI